MGRYRNSGKGTHGHLPAKAPLANPYVPFQLEDPPKYDPAMGIVRGTMFPGLDLPFMGMVNTKKLPETPQAAIQTLAFAVQELALYLDTHRNDTEALELYRAYQKMLHDHMMEYNAKCRPTNHWMPSKGEYRWLDDPWPWEYCANKEG